MPFLIVLPVIGPPLAAAETVSYSPIPAVDCVINPYRVVDVASPVAGVIEELYVERSQQVGAGQVLAQLEASVERANVELARYRAGIQSEIGLGEVNISFDRQRKKRIETLLEEQNISVDNADQVEREVQLSRWKLKQAREMADIRRLELRKAEEQLRQKSIPAPFDGYVLDTFKYRGEYVEDQPILRLAQLDPLVIEAIVPMENFGAIRPGMEAEILAEVLLKDRLRGEVIAVDRIGDTASNTFGVKLSMPNPDNRIPAGLKCVVKFLEPEDEPPVAQGTAQAVDAGADNRIERSARPVMQRTSLALLGEAHAAIPETGAALDPSPTAEDAASDAVEAGDETHAAVDAATGPAPASSEPGPAEETAAAPTSYMVLIEQAPSENGTRDLVERLRDAGVDDFLVFDHGPNRGYISLGVFRTQDNAVNRQQTLDELGFATFTVERFN